jgi:hypothetical protein
MLHNYVHVIHAVAAKAKRMDEASDTKAVRICCPAASGNPRLLRNWRASSAAPSSTPAGATRAKAARLFESFAPLLSSKEIRAMADEAENLVLQQLRAIRGENDKTHRLLFDLTLRVGSLEQKVAFGGANIARIDTRLDGFEKRLDRIEKRLGLIDA